MTPDELDAIEQRADAATMGPWSTDESEQCWRLFGGTDAEHPLPLQLAKCPKHSTPYAEYWPTPEDSAFIVAARSDVPVLLAEVRRLREALDACRVVLETCDWTGPYAELNVARQACGLPEL